MAIDPVCKMDVDESNPPGGKTECEGRTYYVETEPYAGVQ